MTASTHRSKIGDVRETIDILRNLKKTFFRLPKWPFHPFPFGLWFRGHSQVVKGGLEPRVFRSTLPNTAESGTWEETNIYDVLRLRVPVHEHVYRSAFDWLCLMQHYSVPTRLLDWSESILSALYFAVREHPEAEGELVVLNAKRLNAISKKRPTISEPTGGEVIIRAEMATTRSAQAIADKDYIKKLPEFKTNTKPPQWLAEFTKPLAVFPSRRNDRMVFQASVFTLHGGKQYVKGMKAKYQGKVIPPPVSLDAVDRSLSSKEKILRRYSISSAAKKRIFEQLFNLGIHEGTLFPEVDHQALYLEKLWWSPDRTSGAAGRSRLRPR